MNSDPAYPRRFPWFRFLGLLIGVAVFVWLVSLWLNRASVVERYDLFAYLRTTAPELPLWHTYTVVMSSKDLATSGDAEGLTLATSRVDHDKLRTWLRENVYYDQPLLLVLRWPVIGAGLVLLFGIVGGGYLDRRINSNAREGRILRGPRLVSKWCWNWGIWGKNRGFFIETQ